MVPKGPQAQTHLLNSTGEGTLKGTSILDCGTAVHEGSGAPPRGVGAWVFAGAGFPLDVGGAEIGADARSASQGSGGGLLSSNVISEA